MRSSRAAVKQRRFIFFIIAFIGWSEGPYAFGVKVFFTFFKNLILQLPKIVQVLLACRFCTELITFSFSIQQSLCSLVVVARPRIPLTPQSRSYKLHTRSEATYFSDHALVVIMIGLQGSVSGICIFCPSCNIFPLISGENICNYLANASFSYCIRAGSTVLVLMRRISL